MPASPFPAPPVVGFLLFNQHLRDSGGRAAGLRHHRSWSGQHGLHLGLGNCWRPPLASRPPPRPSPPVPPPSCAAGAPRQALTLAAGVPGRAGWTPDAAPPGPGGNVWLCHLDDHSSASAGEAWGLGREPRPGPWEPPPGPEALCPRRTTPRHDPRGHPCAPKGPLPSSGRKLKPKAGGQEGEPLSSLRHNHSSGPALGPRESGPLTSREGIHLPCAPSRAGIGQPA